MRLSFCWLAAYIVASVLLAAGNGQAQTDYYFGGSGALNAATWSTNPAGPFTDSFVNGNNANFGVAGTMSGGSIVVARIAATASVTLSSPTGTISNLGNGVVTIDVASGVTLDFFTQSFTASTTAGYIKTGSGVVALAGNTYGGGFTLNAGTVILRGVNALGGSGTNTLTLNGGIVASNANRVLTNKYGGGITIGGDVQFGDTTGLASSTANLTFTNDVSLGSTTRTLTLGNGGVMTFSGVISNLASAGVTFAATANGTGRFDITNTSNLLTGTTTILGGEVRYTADLSLGPVPIPVQADSIVIDGGRLATANAVSFELHSNRGIQVGATAGTAISTTGAGTLTYNGIIADKPGAAGSWAKQGAGTLLLGGQSTYTGNTSITNGTLRLQSGSDRLPTGTTVNLGETGTANLGTFDLNGNSQTIAGLNSVTGTNSTGSKNTVTSATAATLTIGGSGTYSYGDSTTQNSGVITGAVSVVKAGTGTQTLGDENTYSGGTTVSGGTLLLNTAGLVNPAGSGPIVVNGGTLGGGGNGTIGPSVELNGGKLAPGMGTGAVAQFKVANTVTFHSGATFELQINGLDASTNHDQLLVTGGNTVLDGTLTVEFGTFSANLGDKVYIINNVGTGTMSGAFSNAPVSGSAVGTANGFTWLIFYNADNSTGLLTGGNDVVLFAVIPEPGHLLAVCAGIAAVGGCAARRLRRLA